MTRPISVRMAFVGMVASLALAGWANKALSSPDTGEPRIELSLSWDMNSPTVLAGGPVALSKPA